MLSRRVWVQPWQGAAVQGWVGTDHKQQDLVVLVVLGGGPTGTINVDDGLWPPHHTHEPV